MTLEFQFTELPLVIEGGFEAGLVTGEAEIAYHRDGEWSVRGIYLEGFRERSQAGRATMQANGLKPSFYERKPVEVDRGTFLFNTILHRLEHEWADRVQEAVNEARVEDRAAAADDRADMRRDAMREAV
jgi:hypothetical protein